MAEERTIPVELPAALVEAAGARAADEGETLVAMVVRVVGAHLATPSATPGLRNGTTTASKAQGNPVAFFERLQEKLKAVPPEEWDKIPHDGSLDPDRYIYGRP